MLNLSANLLIIFLIFYLQKNTEIFKKAFNASSKRKSINNSNFQFKKNKIYRFTTLKKIEKLYDNQKKIQLIVDFKEGDYCLPSKSFPDLIAAFTSDPKKKLEMESEAGLKMEEPVPLVFCGMNTSHPLFPKAKWIHADEYKGDLQLQWSSAEDDDDDEKPSHDEVDHPSPPPKKKTQQKKSRKRRIIEDSESE